MSDVKRVLEKRMSPEPLKRLLAIDNAKLYKFIADAIELTNPKLVFVCTDSDADIQYIRDLAIKNGEESPLAVPGHTVHYDGYHDQGRDKEVTKYLLPKGWKLGGKLNTIDKAEGIAEVRSFLTDSMVGREMLVCFWCLGPTDSVFSIPCVQITDSPYVAHSESILYRRGYAQFAKLGDSPNFFRFLHSEGELENFVSKQVDKKRIYIDLEEDLVYSVNTQYAGNTVGLKKLALRLAIQKASKEGWLAEHMFIMGAKGPQGRVTYFAGAFPSACGKTSTSMLPGQTIVGDDIAYFRKKNGRMRTVNVEKGIFGIIQDVNPQNDPVIYEPLTKPNEVIFSNVLVDKNKKPWWLGMGCELPKEGVNHAGKWKEGMTDATGAKITASHKNARYCLNIADLSNMDPLIDDPEGIPVGGIIYGGRDSDTWVPVEQAFDWNEGIIAKGASIESETTAATIGAEGVRAFNLMSNLDFLAIPMGKYIQINLDFAKGVKQPPSIFSVNYFLRDENGKYLNGMLDKLIWVLWAERRVNRDVDAVKTPTGYIPLYEDLAALFKEHLGKQYTQADYVKQFTFRVPQNLAKLDRVEAIYRAEERMPQVVFETFAKVRARLKAAQQKHGRNISPFDLIEK